MVLIPCWITFALNPKHSSQLNWSLAVWALEALDIYEGLLNAIFWRKVEYEA